MSNATHYDHPGVAGHFTVLAVSQSRIAEVRERSLIDHTHKRNRKRGKNIKGNKIAHFLERLVIIEVSLK